MKAFTLFALLGLSLAWSQSAPPPSGGNGDSVKWKFEDGTTLTEAQFKRLLEIHPSWQKLPEEQVIHEYGIVLKASALAEQNKLKEKSPYKEAIEYQELLARESTAFQSMLALANAWAQENTDSIKIEPAEIEKYYNDNKSLYQSVKVNAIRVSFGANAAPADSSAMASRAVKKVLTQEEAKAKAGKLAVDIRGGADFCKTALMESDDDNKTKCGELATPFKMTDNLPQDLRDAVMRLKEGEISEPVQQSQSYYIFRATTIAVSPLTEVRDSIFDLLKQQKTHEWMQGFDKSVKVQVIKPNDPVPPAPAPSDLKK